MLAAQIPPLQRNVISVSKVLRLDMLPDDPEQLVRQLKHNMLTIVQEAKAIDKLIVEFEYTRAKIARMTGKSETFLTQRRALVKLQPEILEHFESGKIPCTRIAINALTAVPEQKRVALVQMMIERDQTTSTQIKAVCEPYLKKRKRKARKKAAGKSAAKIIESVTPNSPNTIPLTVIQESAQSMCAKCEARESDTSAELAWGMITKAIGQTCDDCKMDQYPAICQVCPFSMFAKELSKLDRN